MSGAAQYAILLNGRLVGNTPFVFESREGAARLVQLLSELTGAQAKAVQGGYYRDHAPNFSLGTVSAWLDRHGPHIMKRGHQPPEQLTDLNTRELIWPPESPGRTDLEGRRWAGPTLPFSFPPFEELPVGVDSLSWFDGPDGTLLDILLDAHDVDDWDVRAPRHLQSRSIQLEKGWIDPEDLEYVWAKREYHHSAREVEDPDDWWDSSVVPLGGHLAAMPTELQGRSSVPDALTQQAGADHDRAAQQQREQERSRERLEQQQREQERLNREQLAAQETARRDRAEQAARAAHAALAERLAIQALQATQEAHRAQQAARTARVTQAQEQALQAVQVALQQRNLQIQKREQAQAELLRQQQAREWQALLERAAQQRRDSIRRIAQQQGIPHLTHFTQLDNLEGILLGGLISRAEQEDGEACVNDHLRADGRLHATCLSVSHPNYRMFYRYRQRNTTVGWVVLVLDPCVLWELDCGFVEVNAATAGVPERTDADLKTPGAFRNMFENDALRQRLQLPAHYTTDPQAEVLVFETIPTRFIREIHVDFKPNVEHVRDAMGRSIPVRQRRTLFAPRHDYAHWQDRVG